MVKKYTGRKDCKQVEEHIPFENIDLGKCTYSELKSLEQQLKTQLQTIRCEIEMYEENPENEDEIGAWSESEYLQKIDEAEKNYQTEW